MENLEQKNEALIGGSELNAGLGDLPNPALALKRIFGELLRCAEDEIQALERDRDEWKQQHENLVEVRRQDLAIMQKRIDFLEDTIKLFADKPPAKPGRLMFAAPNVELRGCALLRSPA